MAQGARAGLATAGGIIRIGGGATFVKIEGRFWAQLGAPVDSHGNPPHASPTMVQGSSLVTIRGVPVVISGNAASCGHVAQDLGSIVSVSQ